MKKNNDENPKFSDQVVPFWIKLMWTVGIIWIVVYIVSGLRETALTW